MAKLRRNREYILSVTPPFPRNMLLEVSNICNNDCIFCGHHNMRRKQENCNKPQMLDIIQQAYDAGTREIGFYLQGEPFLNPDLEEYISFCKNAGFEYIYMTTNGVGATAEKVEKLNKLGLSSIKFSINAATRDTYRIVHRRDHFDSVMKNFMDIVHKKREGNITIPIFVSYVVVPENEGEIELFKEKIGVYCDDVDIDGARNMAGNMPELPCKNEAPCIQLFNRLHITKEGCLNASCGDIDNMLAAADLRQVPLKEAWNCPEMMELRRQHLAGEIGNTICYDCIYGRYDKEIAPINKTLYHTVL